MSSFLPFSHPTIIKKLLGWKKIQGEDKSSEKHIKNLVRKLKKGNVVDELLKALGNQDPNTKCVTISMLVLCFSLLLYLSLRKCINYVMIVSVSVLAVIE